MDEMIDQSQQAFQVEMEEMIGQRQQAF